MEKLNKINPGLRRELFSFASLIILYKIALEYGFWFILRSIYIYLPGYTFEFNIFKYFVGILVVCIVATPLFLLTQIIRLPSAFFLQLHFYIAIVPITVIYSFSDESTLYYLSICILFTLVEIVIYLIANRNVSNTSFLDKDKIKIYGTRLVVYGFAIITLIVYADCIYRNGTFSLSALNIYNVYDIRSKFVLNKYVGYMFTWQYSVINPFFIIRGLIKDRKIESAIFVILQIILYLYAAQKTILFIIPLLLVIYHFSKTKKFSTYVYGGLTALTCITVILYDFSAKFEGIYGLLIRRVLLLPANLKFLYYDYFSNGPKIGFYGTLIGKYIGSQYPYDDTVGHMISKEYFYLPDMSSNTGFLAEGYYRFGLWGILLSFVLLGVLLVLIDRFSRKNGFEFSIGLCLFSIFLLNDGPLIDPFIFGNITVLVFVFLLYDIKFDCKSKSRCKGALTEYDFH